MEMLEATLIQQLHNTKLMEGSIKNRSMQPAFIIQPYSDSGVLRSKNISRAQSPYSALGDPYAALATHYSSKKVIKTA